MNMMVGNLGAYQIMTTLAKTVGGPIKLGGIIALISGAGGGILAYRSRRKIEHFGYSIKNKLGIPNGSKKLQKQKCLYRCHSDYKISNGLTLKKNDRFSVLYADNEMALINVAGDDNNPYMVDRRELEKISNYKE